METSGPYFLFKEVEEVGVDSLLWCCRGHLESAFTESINSWIHMVTESGWKSGVCAYAPSFQIIKESHMSLR